MKTVRRKLGLLVRLSMTAAALLMGQQAMALGTDPGVDVDNTALVDYEVNGVGQTQVPSTTASFVVDRRVDFTVTRMGIALTPTTLGALAVDSPVAGNYLDFYVTNLSNGDLDFNLLFTQLASGFGEIYPPGPGTADTDVDMNNVRIRVSSAIDPAGSPGTGPEPLLADDAYIDNLPEDRSIRVRLYADTPAALANTDVAGLSLDASAADPTGTVALPGANLLESGIWNQGTVDNVFADNGNDNAESDVDGFDVTAPDLTVAKAASIVAPGTRALPGERIEYLITIDNTGGADAATNISIGDLIDDDVTFVPDAYNGGSSNIVFDQGLAAESFCNADDAGDTDGDGCSISLAPITLTIAGRNAAGDAIDVAAGAIVTVRFQVEIPAL
ncbi:MAG: hypothetical protein OER97_06330 [Gammaproteobacteria bacterium]|nr:hypothetical protein [Gammaproteobacteria bacterium]